MPAFDVTHLPLPCRRFPWNNWHSSQVRIDMLADPVLSRSEFVKAISHAPPDQGGLTNADDLQTLIVEPGIAQWTSARLKTTVLQVGGCSAACHCAPSDWRLLGTGWLGSLPLCALIGAGWARGGLEAWRGGAWLHALRRLPGQLLTRSARSACSRLIRRTQGAAPMHAPSAVDLCDAQDGTIVGNARFLLQHVLATPTVNFISSLDRSKRASPGNDPIRLPLSFFVNSQALALVDIAAKGAFRVPYALYRETLVECAHLQALNPRWQAPLGRSSGREGLPCP